MKILLTGATGFLGRHLVRHLLADGHELRCLVRSIARGLDIKQPGVELVGGCLTDIDAVRWAARGVSTVVHAAGQLGGWGDDRAFIRNNLVSTQNIVAACRAERIASVVAVSSVAVYGRQPDRLLAEQTPIRQERDPYCRTKLAAEAALSDLADTTGAAVTVIRPSIIFGPHDTHFCVPVIRQLRRRLVSVVGDRHHGLPLVYAGDVARFVTLRVRQPERGFHAFNLSSPEHITWSDLADGVAAHDGRSASLVHVPYGMAYAVGALLEGAAKAVHAHHAPLLTRFIAALLGRQYWYDSSKALSVPGFGSFTPFRTAFKESMQWLSSIPR